MSLHDWERNGWLQRHKTSPNEIRELLAVVERDLADSAAEGLSADWRMNIAYNPALQAATMALAAAGYRASRDQHHYRVIQSLRETLGTDTHTVNAFDAFRKKRNVAVYDRAGLVSDADAASAMMSVDQQLPNGRRGDRVIGYLRFLFAMAMLTDKGARCSGQQGETALL